MSNWIDVVDEPLYTLNERGEWECTDAGMQPILAAVMYHDRKQPNKELWWIMPCVIEDGRGLCIIGDEENVTAGWDLTDVQFYKPLDLAPPSPPIKPTNV